MKIYFKYRRYIDYFTATAVAIIVFQPFLTVPVLRWPTDEGFIALTLAIAGSSASLLGFVLAANTFLISHTQHRRLNLLRKSAGYVQLINIMKSNLWRLLALTILSGVSSLVAPAFIQFALIAITFVLALSLISLATLIWATMAVLAIPLD